MDRRRKREAERIVALPDEQFHAELEKRFGLHLGDIAVVGPRRAYPLGLFVARSFIADRIALDRRRRACDPSDRGAGA